MATQSNPEPANPEPARAEPATAVLLTRPDPQGQRFARQIAARFGGAVRAVASPLMVARFVPPQAAVPAATALILTSGAGVEAARRIKAAGHALPRTAFCVGDRTAQAARAAGFDAQSAAGDAAALIALILARAPTGLLLHLCGQDSRGDVADTLAAGGLTAGSLVAYVQEPQPLTPEAQALLALGQPVVLPLFSPRSARLFGGCAPAPAAPLHVIALSPAVADAAPCHASLHLAARPDAQAMLDALAEVLRLLANSRAVP